MQPQSSSKHVYDPLGDCGKGKCPVCARNNALYSLQKTITKPNFSSSSNAVFVGRFNYPNINVGILAPPDPDQPAELYDTPASWAQKNFQIPQIVRLRSALLNSRKPTHVTDVRKSTKLLDIGKELAMARKPSDIEINLARKPTFRLQTDQYHLPMGPPADVKKAILTENPKIDHKIDKVVSDTDLKTNDALKILYDNKRDEHTLTKLLSIGNLGIKKDRKLVPTRWAITGVDSNVGNHLVDQIKTYREIGYRAYFGSYLGNYILTLTFPDMWSYELFETYVPPNTTPNQELKFTTDYEPFQGRKKYAQNTAGGFYAARIAVLNHLASIRRQASVLILRFITDEYSMPLGVFVFREAVRNAMNAKPLEFGSKQLMLTYAESFIKRKFNWDVNHLLKQSVLLKEVNTQMKLSAFA